jgi:hypothetical protein
MGVKFANNAATTLAAGISSGVTSFAVASATGFPSLGGSDYMYLTVDSEVVKVTATSGTTFTCDATSGSHSAGDTVELRMSAELLDDFAEDSEALPLSGGQMSGNITMAGSQTVDGRDLSADGTKLDAIEASATADQTNAEIRTAVEAASDSNVFTDADHSKLNAIEASATADQTNAEIRAAVEAASDSNVFTDADHSKLNAVEASADVTDATNVTAAGALMDSEITNLAAVKSFAASDYATAAQGTLAAAALPKAGGTMTGNLFTDSQIFLRNTSVNYINAKTALQMRFEDSSNPEYEKIIEAEKNSFLKLMFNGLEKLTTTANGVTVTGGAVGTMTTDNDGSFSMSASNNFKCTPTGNFTLTFTNIVAQSGNILLVNSGGHTVAAHANTKVDANLLATVSTAGTYLLSYFSDGTNVYMTNSAIYT